MRFDTRRLVARARATVLAGLVLATVTTAAPASPVAAEGFTTGLGTAGGAPARTVESAATDGTTGTTAGDATGTATDGHVHDHPPGQQHGHDGLEPALPKEPPELPGLGPSLTAAGPPQPTYLANRNQYVVLLNGYLASTEGSKNVNGEFQQVIDALKSWGWQGSKIGGVAVYRCDENYTWNSGNEGKPGVPDIHALELGDRDQAGNHQGGPECGSIVFPKAATTKHTSETTIQHLAYHWAWTIRNQIGTQCVNAIGHSMGALVIRYALQRIEAGDNDFPLDICVDDVISLGGSHSGSNNAGVWCPDWQCAQQIPGSSFLNSLTNRHPDTPGGTDWTNMGSTGDDSTPPPGSVNANMDPDHAITYEEDIEHTSNFGSSLYWKNATYPDLTANIKWRDKDLGFEATTLDGPWPIRHADMSMAYNHWGCGVGNTTSAFPLKNGVVTVGEPYTTSSDCWYWVDVHPSSRQLTVRVSSLNNKDMDLFLHQGSPTAAASCSATSSSATETCTVDNAAFGRWYVRVKNYALTRDPFTIQATHQNDCATGVDAGPNHASASLMTPVTNCGAFLAPPLDGEDWYRFAATAGQQITAKIDPEDGADFDLCLFDPSGNVVDCSTNGIGADDQVTGLAGVSGNWRLQVLSYQSKYMGTYNLSTWLETAQNDCDTGVDAGDAYYSAVAISLPKVNCAGMLFNTSTEYDGEDWYKFSATSGQLVEISLTPNASSNYNFCVFDPSGVPFGSCTSGSTGGTDTLARMATSSGDYLLKVENASGTGSYTMSVSATSQNDCGVGGDAGNTHAAASSITLPKSGCSASLHASADTDDYYRFSVTAGQTIEASITSNGSSDFDLCLLNPSGGQIGNCTTGTTGGTDPISHTAALTGEYRLRVKIFTGTGPYTMSVSLVSQNDCGTGVDAGNTHAAATSISLPKSECAATLIAGADTDDYYRFPVTSGHPIGVSMTNNATSDYDICLYQPNGTQVGNCTIGTQGGTDTITHTATTTGDYRVRVTRYSGTGQYTLSVAAGPVTVRRDDNERDTSSPYNFNDDVAVKRLPVSNTDLLGKSTATLYVLAQADSCVGAPSGNKFRLKANGTNVVDFNPCTAWTTSSYTWKAFTVPLSYLSVGTATFQFEHISSSGDWTSRNMYLAVDSDNDYGASDIAFDNNNVNGELMWYLVLS